MMHPRIERLVRRTTRSRVRNGRRHRSKRQLHLDAEHAADSILGSQSELERIQPLVV
jgi:hypothetical protein